MRLISLKLRKNRKTLAKIEECDTEDHSTETATAAATAAQELSEESEAETAEEKDVWIFPPPRPLPNLTCASPVQEQHRHQSSTLESNFKRQLSGRFKKLMHHKTPAPEPVIPAELKPQLRNIYVY